MARKCQYLGRAKIGYLPACYSPCWLTCSFCREDGPGAEDLAVSTTPALPERVPISAFSQFFLEKRREGGAGIPRLRVAIVPPSPGNGRVVISRELRGVVVLAPSSVAIANRDGLPSTRVQPATLSPPKKNRPSGKADLGQNGCEKHTWCFTTWARRSPAARGGGTTWIL